MHITRSYLEVPCVHKSESEAFATIRGTHGTWWSGAASAAEPEERANRARDDADSESYVADFSWRYPDRPSQEGEGDYLLFHDCQAISIPIGVGRHHGFNQ